jgi:di/tricarboxylate transporter
MLLTRCLAWDEVAAALDSGLVLIIVTSLALGSALSVTGAAEYLAVLLVSLVHDLPAPIIICSLLLLFSLLTEVVTNNAVAVIGTPIAVGIAQELGLPELPFVLAVLFGANMSYIMPIGYQTNLLVMGAGGYRFSDFFRVGIPLQVLLWLTLSAALTVWYL